MNRILILILVTILSSCNDNEIKPFDDYEYNVELYKTESPDARDLYEVKCFKRKYKVGLDIVGASERFKEAPLVECSKIFGFKPVAKGNLWALMEYVRKEAGTCIQERQANEAFNGTSEK